ncbi:Delta-1-pyrroline-5-carboxylate synthase A, partial [Frankliniella fusca]
MAVSGVWEVWSKVFSRPSKIVFVSCPVPTRGSCLLLLSNRRTLRTALADHQVTSDSLPEELYFKRIHVFY